MKLKTRSRLWERAHPPLDLSETRRAIDRALAECLPGPGDLRVPATLASAMKYSCEKGKRIRPLLTVAAGSALGAGLDQLLPFACAIELIHTYSLIHDDLPELDDDAVRRGRPTCHAVFGAGVALLAGDAMLAEAFRVLSVNGRNTGLAAGTLLEIIAEVSESAGARGLVAGQVMDLESERKKLGEEEIEAIHLRKTGSLIVTAVRVGAKIGSATEAELGSLTRYGEKLGLAFQISDDILDVVGGLEKTGQAIGGDARKEKATFVSTLGVEAARSKVESLVAESVAEISNLGEEAETLREIAWIVRRWTRLEGGKNGKASG